MRVELNDSRTRPSPSFTEPLVTNANAEALFQGG
jgi:hypothetical protein